MKKRGISKTGLSKLSIILIILIIIISGFLILIAYYNFIFKKPSQNITNQSSNINFEIKSAYISKNNGSAIISIYRTGYGEITKIKYIFKSEDNKEYFYSYTDSNYFPNENGTRIYEIKASQLSGLKDFSSIISFSIRITIKDDSGNETEKEFQGIFGISPVETPMKKTGNKTTTSSSGGGGGSGGGSGDTTPSCSPSKTCSNYIGFCGINLNDGCSNSLNCSLNCNINESYCYNGEGINNLCVNNSFKCEDSDLGKNYTLKGTVMLNISNVISSFSDSCSLNNLTEYFCFYNGTNLIAQNESYLCEHECLEGKCLCKNDPGCSSEGIFCENDLNYNCSISSNGCYQRQNLSYCSDGCSDFIGCIMPEIIVSVATLNDSYNLNEQINLTDPPENSMDRESLIKGDMDNPYFPNINPQERFNPDKFIDGQVIFKLKENAIIKDSKSFTDIDSLNNLLQKHGVKKLERLFSDIEYKMLTKSLNSNEEELGKIFIAEVDDTLTAVEELKKDPNIEYAEPNYLYNISFMPNDIYYPLQWAFNKTEAEFGWNITMGSSDIVIAILDTGVDYNHEDLRDNIWNNSDEIPNNRIDDDNNGFVDDIRGWDFVNVSNSYVCLGEDGADEDNDPMDFNGHGTHCSGIAAARGNNNLGISGVCPNCSIMPVRAGYTYYNCQDGFLSSNAITKGIKYAADNHANIISMSFGGGYSDTIKNAIDYAYTKNVILIAAAGNNNHDYIKYPAGYYGVLSITATDSIDRKASFSNFGYWTDIAAPGVDIFSTVPHSGTLGHFSGYRFLSGTSMATPYIAGVAGLILSKNSSFTPGDVEIILKENIDKINETKYIGNGRVNIRKSLNVNSVDTGSLYIITNVNKAEVFVKHAITQDYVFIGVTPLLMNFSVGNKEIKITKQDYSTVFLNATVIKGEKRQFYANLRPYDIRLRRLTDYTGFQIVPSINGKRIAWEDGRNFLLFGNDIHVIDLDNNQEREIRRDFFHDIFCSIYNDSVVWLASNFSNSSQWGIFFYNLSNNNSYKIADIDDSFRYYPKPKIFNDKVVWSDNSSGSYDVYIYDLNTNQKHAITNNPLDQMEPKIYENKIVWEDNRNGNYDIYLCDLTGNTGDLTSWCNTFIPNGGLKQITINPYYQRDVSIYKNLVAWIDDRDYQASNLEDIYIYNLETNQEKKVLSDNFTKFGTSIYENKISWLNIDEYFSIKVLDLNNHQIKEIKRQNQLASGDAVIYDNIVVWDEVFYNEAEGLLDGDLYMYDLTRPQSKLVNNANTEITGQLKIILQKNISSEWQNVMVVIDKQIIIPANGIYKLDYEFNPQNVKASTAGKYRVYVSFDYEGYNSNNSWEFSVSDTLNEMSSLNIWQRILNLLKKMLGF